MALSFVWAKQANASTNNDVQPFEDFEDARVGIEPAASTVVAARPMHGLKPSAPALPEVIGGTAKDEKA